MNRKLTTSLSAIVVMFVYLSACTAFNDSTVTTTPQANASAPTSTSASLPTGRVAAGVVCETAGAIETSADGKALICSETSIEGEALEQPVWREPPASATASSLDERGLAAIEATRALHPLQEGASDRDLLIFIEEYAQAARFAADAEQAIDESFVKLVEGFMVANDTDYDTALTSTVAMLEGVVVLLDDEDPGHAFSTELLEWYREGSVLTVYGLVNSGTPEAEAQFLQTISEFLSLSPNFTPLSADESDEMLEIGYEGCALASFGDAEYWAEELRLMVDESPPSDRADNAFGYLYLTEIPLTELCPRYGTTWEATKDLLAEEEWYPTPAEYPNMPEMLEGLFR